MLNLDAARHLLSRLPIRDYPSGVLVDFRFRNNQVIALEQLKTQAAAGQPLRALFTKARRVGVSSMVDGIGVVHCIEQPNAEAKIVAHQDETAQGLFSVPLTLITGLPKSGYLIPKPTQDKITFPHPDGNSHMTLSTAKNLVGGRGLGFSFLHLSEAAYYLGRAPFTALLPAVPNHPSTGIFVESTANGKVGVGEPFYQLWLDAVYGRNEYLAIFLGWLEDKVCRRPADEAVKDCPANDDEKDILTMVACSTYCGRCEKCHKALQCVAWRRWALVNICQGDVDLFHQEYPINWEEAFITPHNSAFTREEQRIAKALIRKPLCTGKLEFDISPARVANKSGVVLIPDQASPLHIWALPEEGARYYVGADAARGEDNKDFASAYVWRGETGEGVARYNSRINPESLAELLNFLGLYYNRAMVAVELTGNLGLWTQKVLRDTHRYPNLYRWKGRDDRQPLGYVQRSSIGWETTSRTRSLLLDAFRTAIRFGRCKIYDQQLLSQMQSAEMIEGRWEVRAGHDDILMAGMIGWLIGEQWHTGGLAPMSSKVIDIDSEGVTDDKKSASSPDDMDVDELRTVHRADPDVQGQVRSHFLKVWASIKRATRGGHSNSSRIEGI
jgi:hypothetical protein